MLTLFRFKKECMMKTSILYADQRRTYLNEKLTVNEKKEFKKINFRKLKLNSLPQ